MQIKILPRQIFLIITIVILSLIVGFIFYFVFFQSGINSGVAQVAAQVTALYEQVQPSAADFPIRLKIPKINLDAAIEYVGLTPAGVVGVPAGPVNVAWFKNGPRPGEPGSAIIDGHSGWKNGIPAVFDNLDKLQKGDKIYVQDKKGTMVTFVVRKIKKYSPQADASELFNSTDRKAHLNLVTCAGVWDSLKKTHSQRLVVFTDLLGV